MSLRTLITLSTQIFLFAFCFGQREKIDSLKKALASSSGRQQVECLNTLTEIYVGLPDWFNELPQQSHLDSAELFKQEAQRFNYAYGTTRATSLKAELACEKDNDYREAEKLSREAITLYNKSPNKKGLNRTYWRLVLRYIP
jgi:hypothetical protein